MRDKRDIKMKKCYWTILVVVLLCTACGKQELKEPDVVRSIQNNRDQQLTVIANRDRINNKEEFADLLLQMYKDNAFESMIFSTDMGYPTSLEMAVYKWKDDTYKKKPIMLIEYKPEEWSSEYDIVNTPEKFYLYIDGMLIR